MTKDVPDYAVVGGFTINTIKYRVEEDIIAKLNSIEWWNWSLAARIKNNEIFRKNSLKMEDLNNIEA